MLATKMAPPFSLVAKYICAAVGFYVVLTVLLALNSQGLQGFYFQPKLLALTHLATLGWITMTIFGALFQLVPVLLEVPLWSPRLGQWQFWIYLAGVIGLTFSFWTFAAGWLMDLSAVLILMAGYSFIGNMICTMRPVKRWDVTGYFLIASLVYLFFTITLGATLAINLGHPFLSRSHLDYLKIHAHLGLAGWVLMIIMGVALKLLPMFALSHDYSLRPAKWAFGFTNVGLVSLIAEQLWASDAMLLIFASGLIVSGLLLYISQVYLILRQRVRKSFDTAMKHSIISFASLFVVALLGVLISTSHLGAEALDRMTLTYGFLILFGVISSLIVGQMYKIVPFLVWLKKYAPQAGINHVPALKDMVNVMLTKVELGAFTIGITAIVAGLIGSTQIQVDIGAYILAASALLFGYNIIRIFSK
ncbi:MAG: hypothetical protein Q8921_15425 [Bacteroidota bacterium]|nr:hypothetical protein [Bacteroidota bacterium]